MDTERRRLRDKGTGRQTEGYRRTDIKRAGTQGETETEKHTHSHSGFNVKGEAGTRQRRRLMLKEKGIDQSVITYAELLDELVRRYSS